jgi:hypothetical protein
VARDRPTDEAGSWKVGRNVRVGKVKRADRTDGPKEIQSTSDFIVIAAHGYPGETRVDLAGTAARVIRYAACPLLKTTSRRNPAIYQTNTAAERCKLLRFGAPNYFLSVRR